MLQLWENENKNSSLLLDNRDTDYIIAIISSFIYVIKYIFNQGQIICKQHTWNLNFLPVDQQFWTSVPYTLWPDWCHCIWWSARADPEIGGITLQCGVIHWWCNVFLLWTLVRTPGCVWNKESWKQFSHVAIKPCGRVDSIFAFFFGTPPLPNLGPEKQLS